MVARLDDRRLFLVVNASRKEVDFTHLAANLPERVILSCGRTGRCWRCKGPAPPPSWRACRRRPPRCRSWASPPCRLDGIDCLVSRSGYTGEDGFEISVPADKAEALADRLIAQPEVVPVGLGARDSLRLEAGLCLYGNDIDELTSPIEAGLTWVIGKRRKMDWDFPGGLVMRDQLDNGALRRRVGIRPDGRAPARAQTTIMAEDGTEAGTITSGGFGPSRERTDGHGLCPQGPRRGRHAVEPDGPRQGRCRPPSFRCPSSPTDTYAERNSPDGQQECGQALHQGP